MARTVGIGHQDFETVRKKNNFYIDKTEFIREWWDSDDAVTLIARPRRFGKTLNMSMLEKFFSAEHAGKGNLFEGLAIWSYENFRNIQGKFPVIFISFANVKETTFAQARESICRIIQEVYDRHADLLGTDLLTENEKAEYRAVSPVMNDSTASVALRKMSDYLSRRYGRKTIILLDEYDTPLQEAYINGFWQELMSFMRSLLNSTFKTNPYLERAVMTGITRVSKESIFSDLNNLEVVTTTSKKYADKFGFTEKEVLQALKEYGMTDREKEVKKWYDGFSFGDMTDIYNPWSIINYLDKKTAAPYWANTSSNSLIGKLIQKGNIQIKESFEQLLDGQTITAELDEQIVYAQLDHDESAIWSLLLASGYLAVNSIRTTVSEYGTWKQLYELRLTNFEVKIMFHNMVRSWFAPAAGDYNLFIKAFLSGDVETMNTYMNRVAGRIFSYFDVGNGSEGHEEPERLRSAKAITTSLKGPDSSACFYHGFVLGLIVELIDRYEIKSNRESGFGRYDVILRPRNSNDHAAILEFKLFDARNEDSLEDTVQRALLQIEQKGYATELLEAGIPEENIRKYGFAFQGKKVLIGEGN